MDHQEFSSSLSAKHNPRQEKGTMKELCTTVFAHRAVLSRTDVSNQTRQTYLTSTEKQDEEAVKKTGRDLGFIKGMAERKAATYLAKQRDQQVLQNLKSNLTAMLATVESLEAVTNSEDHGGDADIEDASGIGTPGLNRATRHGRGTKRKQAEEELWKHAIEFHKMAKTMRESGGRPKAIP